MNLPEQIIYEINALCENESITELTKAAQSISALYRSDNKNRSASGRSEILAYAASRMPATFGAVSRALELSLERFGGGISSVADYGAGTGAGIIAAALLLPSSDDNYRDQPLALTAYERDSDMIKLGKRFCELTGIPVNWEKRELTDDLPNEKADLAICAYCVNELPEAARQKFLAALSKSADRILIVEPGTPAAFAEMKKIRAELVSRGFHVAAPCASDTECTLPDGDWCHFSERVQRSKLHKRLKGGDAPYEDEKFCFTAFVRDGVELVGTDGARVLRKPVIQSGRITLRLCDEDGITERTVTKSDPRFKQARKTENGDVF